MNYINSSFINSVERFIYKLFKVNPGKQSQRQPSVGAVIVPLYPFPLGPTTPGTIRHFPWDQPPLAPDGISPGTIPLWHHTAFPLGPTTPGTIRIFPGTNHPWHHTAFPLEPTTEKARLSQRKPSY